MRYFDPVQISSLVHMTYNSQNSKVIENIIIDMAGLNAAHTNVILEVLVLASNANNSAGDNPVIITSNHLHNLNVRY